MSQPDLILVLQMAKVASVSWWQAVAHARPDAVVWHLHCANEKTRAQLTQRRTRTGIEQTHDRTSTRRMGIPSNEQAASIRQAVSIGAPVRIVSGIRDPVDRSMSLLCELADHRPHTRRKLNAAQGATPEMLVDYFRKVWRWAMADSFSGATFEESVVRGSRWYRTWFDTEIREVFGLDLKGTFDRNRRALIEHKGPVGLFVFRVEDLKTSNVRQVLASGSEFLGAQLPDDLPSANTRSERPAPELYEQFRRLAKLPAETLDFIYDAPILKKFYTDDELAAFRSRWAE